MDSDLEYAVQNRLRTLLDEGTAVIEAGAGAVDLRSWLRERLITEVEVCHRKLRAATDDVVRRLAGALELSDPLPPVTLDLASPEDLVAQLQRGPRVLSEKPPMSTRLLGVIMPTYSGMMIALVLPRLFGLAPPVWVIGGIAVTGALVMGGAALAGERQRQRSRRDAEAAGDLRGTVDAFRMVVSKLVRDGVRSVDHQLHTGLGDAVTRQTRRLSGIADAARQGADESGKTGKGRTDIDLDLESIRELRHCAQALIPGDRPGD